MVFSFKKNWQYVFFQKWKNANAKLGEIGRKDSIKGAHLKLDSFGHKLNLFDKALEQLHVDKVNKSEYDQEKADLGYKSAKHVFIDM